MAEIVENTSFMLYRLTSTSDNTNEPSDGPIKPSLSDFQYGSCADDAICASFNINYMALRAICTLLKINPNRKGLSFSECQKIISILCRASNILYKYVSNTTGVTYYQLINVIDRGRYLVVFDKHLSFMKENIVYDTFFYTQRNKYKTVKPTGWWKVSR